MVEQPRRAARGREGGSQRHEARCRTSDPAAPEGWAPRAHTLVWMRQLPHTAAAALPPPSATICALTSATRVAQAPLRSAPWNRVLKQMLRWPGSSGSGATGQRVPARDRTSCRRGRGCSLIACTAAGDRCVGARWAGTAFRSRIRPRRSPRSGVLGAFAVHHRPGAPARAELPSTGNCCHQAPYTSHSIPQGAQPRIPPPPTPRRTASAAGPSSRPAGGRAAPAHDVQQRSLVPCPGAPPQSTYGRGAGRWCGYQVAHQRAPTRLVARPSAQQLATRPAAGAAGESSSAAGAAACCPINGPSPCATGPVGGARPAGGQGSSRAERVHVSWRIIL
jgi:hypothetical protein